MRATQNINRTGRTAPGARLRHLLFTAVMAVLLGVSCVDNEITFFIEHVKVQPKWPNCGWTESDDFTQYGLIDIAFRNDYVNAYLVRNQLMSREDYDNIKAETNGIFVDSFEVSMRTADTNEAIGVSDLLPSEIYIEPESSSIVMATVLSSQVVAEMADSTGCLALTSANYPEDMMFQNSDFEKADPRRDRSGQAVPRDVGTVNTSIRFYGHSQGGVDAESQVFTFPIEMCCGCLVNWTMCDLPCDRYCLESGDIEADNMCTLGVANGQGIFDCRQIYVDYYKEWSCFVTDETTHDTVQSTCTCESSCKAK